MSNKIDIGLNRVTGDIEVSDGDLVLVQDLDRVIQQVKIALKFFKGEWELDTTKGVPYYEDIFEKNPDLLLVTSDIKNAILGVEEVTSVDSIELEYNPDRSLVLSCVIHTPFGNFPINDVLGEI
jgi:hypothetical protein